MTRPAHERANGDLIVTRPVDSMNVQANCDTRGENNRFRCGSPPLIQPSRNNRHCVVTSCGTACSLTSLSSPDRPMDSSRGQSDAIPAFTRNRTASANRSGPDPDWPIFHVWAGVASWCFDSNDLPLCRSAAGTRPQHSRCSWRGWVEIHPCPSRY